MKKSCYNCRWSRSTISPKPRIYCSLRNSNFSKRLPCKFHAFVFADGFAIPVKKGGAK